MSSNAKTHKPPYPSLQVEYQGQYINEKAYERKNCVKKITVTQIIWSAVLCILTK